MLSLQALTAMLALDLFSAKANWGVVVYDADGLHPGVDDDGADEFEAAIFEGFGDFFGERRSSWEWGGVLNGLASGHSPDPF